MESRRQHDFSIVGTSVARGDGADKVTGRAKYTGDLIVPRMIEGKFLRSPYAHARIRAIDTHEAEALPASSPSSLDTISRTRISTTQS